MRIERLNTVKCEGGENPLWDEREQVLYFIDNQACKIHRYDPASNTTRSWDMPTVITTLVLREGGGAIITMRTGIFLFDFDSGAVEALVHNQEPYAYIFNDGKADRRGRFVIGASTARFSDPQPDGGLQSFDADRALRRLDGDIHFSNGPCFSPDDRVLYFSDSLLKTCYAYDYDIESGTVANRRTFASTADFGGLPDGATVDAEGNIWIAVYGGAKVVSFRPDGSLARTIDMPVKHVSSVAFGGANLDRLFVTTIAQPMGEPREPDSGDIYAIDGLGVTGVVEPRYAG